ncbi:MAG: hypothetical protein LBN18_03450 [Dysgonamonadaceae bacterium]|jgi:hypothetical protein|nr:hypothetical protein [Dysgonamonadaceae bacterium]
MKFSIYKYLLLIGLFCLSFVSGYARSNVFRTRQDIHTKNAFPESKFVDSFSLSSSSGSEGSLRGAGDPNDEGANGVGEQPSPVGNAFWVIIVLAAGYGVYLTKKKWMH